MKVTRGLKNFPCEEGLRDLGLLSLERLLQGYLVAAFQKLRELIKKMEMDYLLRCTAGEQDKMVIN